MNDRVGARDVHKPLTFAYHVCPPIEIDSISKMSYRKIIVYATPPNFKRLLSNVHLATSREQRPNWITSWWLRSEKPKQWIVKPFEGRPSDYQIVSSTIWFNLRANEKKQYAFPPYGWSLLTRIISKTIAVRNRFEALQADSEEIS